MGALQNEPEEDEAKRDKAAHNNTVSSLLCRYPANQCVDTGHLARSQCNPALNVGQRLALQSKAIVDRIRLAQDAIRHGMAVVNAVALLEHVFCLGSLGVVGAVLVNVGADIGQKVGAIACLLQRRA